MTEDNLDISLDEQIECIQRELALRKVVYSRQVHAGRMHQRIADLEMARMGAVLETLQKLKTLLDR